MNKIETELIETVKKQLKMDIIFDESEFNRKVFIQCDNKCRLLSHLFHRAGLDVHCDKTGEFEICYNDIKRDEIFDAFYEIRNHPEWVIEFIEKYLDNNFMMFSTFKKSEVKEGGE